MRIHRDVSATLELARQAIVYAQNIIKNSSTTPGLDEDEIFERVQSIDVMRDRIFSKSQILRDLFLVPNNRELRIIKRLVRGPKEFHVGNCGEYAALVVNFLRKQNIEFAERFSILDGDHSFVVIGRDPDSDPNKPETWGKNAVICDAWAGKYYRATEIYKQLNCYRSTSNGNEIYPFSKDNYLKVDKAIGNNEVTALYRQLLLNDAIAKLNIIEKILTEYLLKSDLQLAKSKLQAKFVANDANSSQIDIERQLNKIIRNELNLVSSLPSATQDIVVNLLVNELMKYVAANDPDKNKFFEEILNPSHKSGIYPDEIRDIAKKTLTNK